MAAATTRSFDIHKQGIHNVRIGDSILNPSVSSRLTSVRYNHKPTTTTSDPVTTITPSTGGETLTLKDGDDVYVFTGDREDDTVHTVLLYDPDTQELVLERLDATHNFNLTSAPWEKDASKLAGQYPQLRNAGQDSKIPDAEDEGLFGDDQDEATDDASSDNEGSVPDPDNPFDYRHFLNNQAWAKASPDALTPAVSCVPTAQNTPAMPARRPQTASVQSHTPTPALPPRPKAKNQNRRQPAVRAPTSAAPTIRLDRRASTRPTDDIIMPTAVASDSEADADGEDDDDAGGLTLEFDTSRQRKKSLGLGLGAVSGPISLRSAANSQSPNPSPGLRNQVGAALSARLPARKAWGEGEVEVGFGDSPLDDQDGLDEADEGEEEDEEEDADADADADADDDVEMLALPSPATVPTAAHTQDRRLGREGDAQAAETDQDEDEDDADLEAEMLMAMEADEEAVGLDIDMSGPGAGMGAVAQGAVESESESEEE
ncbi:hypothetical protein LTR04_003391 [Oleoguttula sp. CCFEE 6159]|nr:hypothetical protein LTR04_003391 [Oleoguttula sp. CCFEE 6159]